MTAADRPMSIAILALGGQGGGQCSGQGCLFVHEEPGGVFSILATAASRGKTCGVVAKLAMPPRNAIAP